MKKLIMLAAMLLTAMGGNISAQEAKGLAVIKLAKPKLEGGMPLMQALKDRKTTRELAEGKLTPQQLSELLWAANGVNREDGKRTAPAAINVQSVDIYVVMPEGIYLYDAPGEQLTPVAAGDFRQAAGTQDFVFTAPVNLVYVLDLAKYNSLNSDWAAKLSEEDKTGWAAIAVGCQCQNVSLYCASAGLGTTVRGSVDKQKLGEAMRLRPDQRILLAQTVGRLK